MVQGRAYGGHQWLGEEEGEEFKRELWIEWDRFGDDGGILRCSRDGEMERQRKPHHSTWKFLVRRA